MAKVRAKGVAVYVYRLVPTPAVEGASPSPPAVEFLQLKRTHKTGEYQGSWQIVYGGIKKKETAVAAALRELKEETNLKPAKMFQVEYLENFYLMRDDHVLMMPVFGAEVPADAKIKLNEEHDDLRWIPAADVPAKFMWRSQREAIAIILEDLANPGLAAAELQIIPRPGAKPRARSKKTPPPDNDT